MGTSRQTRISARISAPCWRRGIAPALSLLMLLSYLPGCSSGPEPIPPTPTRRVLRQTHQVVGAARCCVVHQGVQYVARSNQLEVIDAHTGDELLDIDLVTPGAFGPATDMIMHEERLYVVLHRTAVVEITVADALRPIVLRVMSAAQLGVKPTRLAVAGGELFISGDGGVIRHRDGRRLLADIDADETEFGPVAIVSGRLVANAGRRVYDVTSGAYLGAANELISLPESFNRADRMAFVFNTTGGGLGGLMSADVRETATVSFPDPIVRVRACGDRLWFVTNREVVGYLIEGDELVDPVRVPVLGALDVDCIDDDRLALCGRFGRAVFRITKNDLGEGMMFVRVDPAPGKVLKARSNGRLVLGGSDLGVWLYEVDGEAILVDEAIDDIEDPPTQAIALDVTAVINPGGESVGLVTPQWSGQYVNPDGGTVHTVIAIDGEIWIGHDTGISVLRIDPETYVEKVDGKDVQRIRYIVSTEHFVMEGPIRYMFPLLDGTGVSYASTYGGFGVIRVEYEPIR